MVSADKGIQAFRKVFETMDNRSRSDHILVEFKRLGGITMIEIILYIALMFALCGWAADIAKRLFRSGKETKKETKPVKLTELEKWEQKNYKILTSAEMGAWLAQRELIMHMGEKRKIDFLEFLVNHINPNEMEKYRTMYESEGNPTEGSEK